MTKPSTEEADVLRRIADDNDLLEVGRLAVEDVLIEFRDSRISLLGRNNGLVVKEYDGTFSDIIRLSTEAAIRIGLRAIAEKLSPVQSVSGRVEEQGAQQ